MTDQPTAYASTGGYSLRRVWDFARYCMPRLGKQMLIYAIVSVVCMFLSIVEGTEALQVGLFVLVWTAIPLIYYCTPLVFAKGPDARIVDRLVPVSAAERLTFYYIYLLVIIPAIVFLPPLAGIKIYMMSPEMQTPGALELYKLKVANFGMLSWINFIGGIFTCLLCFLCVERPRFNRLLWGIVAVIGANFLLGVMGAILAGTAAFKAGFQDGFAGKAPMDDVPAELVQRTFTILGDSNPLTFVMLVVLAIMTVVVALLTYRTLKRRNL